MVCPYCTTKNLAGAQVCSHCGAILREIKRARPAPKEKTHLGNAAKSLLVGNKWRAQHALVHSRIKGTLEKAEAQCEAALKTHGSSPQTRLHLGVLHLLQDQIERSVQEFQQAQRLGATGPEFFNNAGVALARRGNLPQSLDMFERAVTPAPGSERGSNGCVPPHSNLAHTFARLSEGHSVEIAERAVGEVQKALSHDGKNPTHYNRLGLVFCRQGRCDEALAQFSQALTLSEGRETAQADAHNNKGLAHAQAGEWTESAAEFQQALKLDPSHGRALSNQALLLLRQSESDSAIQNLHRAARLDPKSALVRNSLGYALSKALAINEGILEFKEAIMLDALAFEPYYNQGKSYLDEGLTDIAERYLNRAVQINAQSWEAQNTLGVLRMALHQSGPALEAFRAANEMCHNMPLILSNLGLCLAISGHEHIAERAFRQAAQIAKEDPETNLNLAWLSMRRHDISHAVAELQIALSRNDRLAIGHNNYGLCEIEMGSYDEALRHFRRALQIAPDLGPVHYHIGGVYMLLKQMDQAVKEWEIAAKLEPTNPDCFTNLGVAYYKNGRMDLAIIEFRRVITLRQSRMEDFSNLALCYAKQGMALKQQSRKPDDPKAREAQERSKLAVEMFDRALILHPQNVMLHSNRGLACFFANRPDDSMAEWMAVTRLDPEYARRRGKTQQSEFDDTMMAFVPVDTAARAMPLPFKTADYLTRFAPSYDADEWELILTDPALQSLPEMTRQSRHLERQINSL